MNKITIMLMTYAPDPGSVRASYAIRTIRSVSEKLKFDGELGFYLCDSGSHPAHLTKVLNAIEASGIPLVGQHSEALTPGASWNKGLVFILANIGPAILMLEDDWVLEAEFDITPYYQLLSTNESVGIVRLGWLNVGIKTEVVGFGGRHYLRMVKDERQHTYSGNPHLRHGRFDNFYGMFNEDINPSPGDVEIDYDGHFRSIPGGPSIVWPVEIGGWGKWGHIGTVQSYGVKSNGNG